MASGTGCADFITLDGPSAVGKATICRLLGTVLTGRGVDSVVTTTPSTSSIGRLARQSTHDITGHALSCLVAADRYHHHQTVIAPALAAGRTVVCDRYMPSALALDRIDGVTVEYIAGLYSMLARPHFAFVLVGDASRCAARAAARGTSYSRFHTLELDHHGGELQLFEEAIEILRDWDYPVWRLDIDTLPPRAIAEIIADTVDLHQGAG